MGKEQKERKIIQSFLLRSPILEHLEEYSTKNEAPKSYFIRRAIFEYLEKHDNDKRLE